MKPLFLFLFLLPLFSALKVDLNCPEEVFLSEEFECEIFLKNNFLSYDVKLNLVGKETTINQIWEGSSWQRSDWYAKELINGEKTFIRIKLIKNFSGEAKGTLKLKSSRENKLVYEEEFSLGVKERENFLKNSSISIKKEIVLNSKDIKTENLVFLQEKNFLYFSGIVFLGLISGILYFTKIKNGRRKFKEDTFGNNY